MRFDEIVDVVVVGSGAAGTITAIAAEEEGACVLVVEKQPKEDRSTSSAMSGANFFLPRSESAMQYLEALNDMPGESKWMEQDIIRRYVDCGMTSKSWIENLGMQLKELPQGGEHADLPEYEAFVHCRVPGSGPAMQRFLDSKVREKEITVSYGTRAKKLIAESSGRVLGVEAERADGTTTKRVRIGASKGVVLATGGFEFDDTMKQNYLPVHPTYFTGHPSATGDGIKMAQAVGADLWHMNCVSGRVVAKVPECPSSLSVSLDGRRVRPISSSVTFDSKKRAGYIIVDRGGKRFINEDYKIHSVYYELTCFDTQRMVYPRVPCYWIMDQRRVELDTLVYLKSGATGPCRMFQWSRDNSVELERGWILTAGSIRGLADKLGIPSGILEKTVSTYNRHCARGKDPDFGRKADGLMPLDVPPFYAMKLWPGGPNTQGGPKRNARCQVLNMDGEPIPGLYSAGEMGSMFGMFYPGGGSNLAECLTMGRVAGEEAAHSRLTSSTQHLKRS